MKKLILITLFLISLPAFSKSVTMTVSGKITLCPKKGDCTVKDLSTDLNIQLSPLPNAGLDYGIGNVDYKTPSQKFGFKAIASSLSDDKNMQIMFAIYDQSFKMNTFILDLGMPEDLNAKLVIISPDYTDSNGLYARVQVEVSKVSTQL